MWNEGWGWGQLWLYHRDAAHWLDPMASHRLKTTFRTLLLLLQNPRLKLRRRRAENDRLDITVQPILDGLGWSLTDHFLYARKKKNRETDQQWIQAVHHLEGGDTSTFPLEERSYCRGQGVLNRFTCKMRWELLGTICTSFETLVQLSPSLVRGEKKKNKGKVLLRLSPVLPVLRVRLEPCLWVIYLGYITC